MASITLGGNPCNTNGNLPEIGQQAKDFTLVKSDLSHANLSDFSGNRVILNIFPSVDTGVCAASVRHFNERAAALNNTKVLCISRDLPFAQSRFCGAEGIENVIMLSDFANGSFGNDYGIMITDGGFKDLHARGIVILDESGKVIHTELVSEIGDAINFEAALAVL